MPSSEASMTASASTTSTADDRPTCGALCRPHPLTAAEARYFFLRQLVVFTLINSVTHVINLASQDMPAVEVGATVLSLAIVVATVPFGLVGARNESGGVVGLYVMLGAIGSAATTCITMAAFAIVAATCQLEQAAFRGCAVAATTSALPCVVTSNCTRAVLDAYNEYAAAEVACLAWSVEECAGAPTTLTDFEWVVNPPVRFIFFILDIFTSAMPVYFGFLYYARLEAARAGKGKWVEGASDADDAEAVLENVAALPATRPTEPIADAGDEEVPRAARESV